MSRPFLLVIVLLTAVGCRVEADHPLDPDTPTSKQHKARLGGQVAFADGLTQAKREATKVRLIGVDTDATTYVVKPDSQGSFLFKAVEPGQYRLRVATEGYFGDDRLLVLGRLEEVDVGRIVMRPGDEVLLAPIVGRARLQGAEGHAGTTVAADDTGRVAMTADDGRFVLDVPAGAYTLLVAHAGHVSQTVEIVVPTGGTELAAQVLLVPVDGRVSGVVRLRRFGDADRVAAIDVVLQQEEGESLVAAVAAADGDERAFEFEGLATGTWTLTAQAEGYDEWSRVLTLGPGAVSTHDIELPHSSTGPDVVDLGGRVVLADGGGPGGTRIAVGFDRWDTPFSTAVTDADGAFVLTAAPDEAYTLRAERDGYDAAVLAPVTWDADDQRFEDEDGDPIVLTLRP